MQAGGAPREVELKLEIDPADLARLRELPIIRDAGQEKRETLRTVYFDTDRSDLRKAGVTLRVRRSGDRRVQTIKAAKFPAGGLFDRDEWETEVDHDDPDLGAAKGTALEPVIAKDRVRRRIRPVFVVETERTTYELAGATWAVDLTLDEGSVEAAGRRSLFCELELELRAGQLSRLFALARDLSASLPARLAIMTKAERGYGLLDDKPRRALKAKPSSLSRAMTAGEAFQAVARACLQHLLGNERLLHASRDPAIVHQMRVAIRRTRAAISLFKEVVHDDRREPIRKELKWIANELGPARDPDVFIAEVVEPLRAQHPDALGLEDVARSLETRRRGAYETALAAVTSPRFRVLVIDVAAWVETGRWLADCDERAREVRDQPVADFAAAMLTRRRKRVRKQGRHLAELDAPSRHAVRIEVKKLRYAAEFFAPLFEARSRSKRRERFLRSLEELQEHLGILNDVSVGSDLGPDPRPADAAGSADPHRRAAAELIAAHQSARSDAALQPALDAYTDLAEAKAFWR